MCMIRVLLIVFVILWCLGGFVVTTGFDTTSNDPYVQIRADRVALFQLAVTGITATVNAFQSVRSAVETTVPEPAQPAPAINPVSGRSI